MAMSTIYLKCINSNVFHQNLQSTINDIKQYSAENKESLVISFPRRPPLIIKVCNCYFTVIYKVYLEINVSDLIVNYVTAQVDH